MTDTDTDGDEELLTGGFSNVVTRQGNTIRRNVGPWTASVHVLLRHLRSAGFDLAPEPLGIDQRGREVLGLIEGQVAWWPWPEALRRDDGLRAVASMLNDLRGAISTFDEPADAIWHGGPRTSKDHVIRHGDLAPWNTLWADGRLVGLIDWDTAEPAPAGWDAAQGAWYFVPLRPLDGYRTEGVPMDFIEVTHRLEVWCAELDLDLESLLDQVSEVQEFERDRILSRGNAGHEPYATFLARGDADDIDHDRQWLLAHRSALLGC